MLMFYKKLLFILAALATFISPAAVALEVKNSDVLTETFTSDLSGMRETRVLRALVVPNKTNYFFDGAVQRGISYEALQKFEEHLNVGSAHHEKLHILYIPVRRDQLIPALVEGRGDLAVANLTINEERAARVDFSTPLMKNVKELIVTHSSTPELNALEDLAGRQVHVRRSSSYYPSLVKLNGELRASGLPYMQLVIADEKLEDEDLLEMVNAGLIPAIAIDSHTADFWEQVFANIRAQRKLVLADGGEIAWAFRKNSPELEQAVNEFVRGIRKGTLLGNILLKRYLKNTSYVTNALASKEMKKFEATSELFRSYANQYEFDWLMLIAQGYQESRLDQSTRSHAGAVGIMQLLPSTAADKNVAIDDIHQVENNIHAGAKYMRFLRNRYFSDSDMDEMEQTLFSFAAYNAGPARITKLRSEAAKLGLDPDLWFDNVEVVAAKRIGRETVQYVANIYKYWAAYKLAEELGDLEGG